MKKRRPNKHKSDPAAELARAACEICGAPYRLIQSHDQAWGAAPGTGYGAYAQTCKCERPAPKTPRPNDPDVPF
jgi:hypothetical protein